MEFSNRHTDFVHWNLYSSVIHSQLSFIPDFDMFASTPSANLPIYHGLLRCLTPGPTLLADMPGEKSDMALIEKMTSTTKSGRFLTVKTDDAVQTLPNRLFWDNVLNGGEGPALVGGVAIPGAHGAIIGAWNVRDWERGGSAQVDISRRDVEDVLGRPIHEDEEYLLSSVGHSKGNEYKFAAVTKSWDGTLSMTLKKGEAEAVIVTKYWTVKGRKVAVVGLLDKFAPLAGVTVSVENGKCSLFNSERC